MKFATTIPQLNYISWDQVSREHNSSLFPRFPIYGEHSSSINLSNIYNGLIIRLK